VLRRDDRQILYSERLGGPAQGYSASPVQMAGTSTSRRDGKVLLVPVADQFQPWRRTTSRILHGHAAISDGTLFFRTRTKPDVIGKNNLQVGVVDANALSEAV
jgi:hypothetical protein